MNVSERRTTSLIAMGLMASALASGVAYWRLQAAPAAYGVGAIEAGEIRIGSEAPGRSSETSAVEGRSLAPAQS